MSTRDRPSPYLDREPAEGGSLRLRHPEREQRVYEASELREIDRLARDEFGLPVLVLMENAAIGAARVALEMLGATRGGGAQRPLTGVAGGGHNGGDALALARHAANAIGTQRVRVLLDRATGSLEGPSGLHARVCAQMGLRVDVIAGDEPLMSEGVLVDGLLGTGLGGAPREKQSSAIRWINRGRQAGASVLSLDLPSGMLADTGEAPGACVHADRTATFAGLKAGFLAGGAGAAELLGEVEVVGIGVPETLLERFGRPLRGGPGRSADPAERGERGERGRAGGHSPGGGSPGR